jgi:CRP-like cAMP-binding protein
MESADRIAAIAAIFDCVSETADRVNRHCTVQRHASNTVIAHQGDRSVHCAIIVEGSAHVRLLSADGQYTQLTTFEAGEVLGSFPGGHVHRADIVAMGTLILLRIAAADLAAIVRDDAAIFSRQFDGLFVRLAARVTLTATGRVYAELARLAGDRNVISPPPVVAGLAIRAQTTRETASRAIGVLERRGIIRRSADRLDIVAPRMLADLTA